MQMIKKPISGGVSLSTSSRVSYRETDTSGPPVEEVEGLCRPSEPTTYAFSHRLVVQREFGHLKFPHN
jgi:hypothetical protein